jgi:hypothetical protein
MLGKDLVRGEGVMGVLFYDLAAVLKKIYFISALSSHMFAILVQRTFLSFLVIPAFFLVVLHCKFGSRQYQI